MIQPHNRHMSFSLYIGALAVVDTIVVLCGKTWFLPTAYGVRRKVMFWHVSVHPSIRHSVCPHLGGVPGQVPGPGGGGTRPSPDWRGYLARSRWGRGYPDMVPPTGYPLASSQWGGTQPGPKGGTPAGYPHRVPPSQLPMGGTWPGPNWGGTPQQGTPRPASDGGGYLASSWQGGYPARSWRGYPAKSQWGDPGKVTPAGYPPAGYLLPGQVQSSYMNARDTPPCAGHPFWYCVVDLTKVTPTYRSGWGTPS